MRGGGWGGHGAGPGRGGFRWRHWYHATGRPRWARSLKHSGFGYPPAWAYDAAYDTPPSQEQEVEMLKDEAEWLKEQLDAINARMDELSQE
jgi:hypothetical protein